MTEFQIYRLLTLLVVFAFAPVAFAQNNLDLKEAVAREAAYIYMSSAEEQFDCKFEEHSMRGIGKKPDERYLFQVKTDGDECGDALIFLTNLAAREDRLIFRQLYKNDQQTNDLPILPGQVLIHEVNPEIEDDEKVEDETRSPVPQ